MTELQIAMAATNSPDLAPTSFTLGDREFKVVNLRYMDQCAFLAYLGPVLTEVFAQLHRGGEGGLGLYEVLQHCAEKLPAIVQLSCKQTDPSVTVQWVEDNTRSPIQLANIVMMQANQNKLIDEVAGFFGQILGLVEAMLPKRESETPSS